MSEIEYADSDRGASPFPASWGTPVGSPSSQERRDWVQRNARLQSVLDLDKREARKIADQVHREVNAAVLAGHLTAWAAVIAKLLKNPDKLDAKAVDGHLAAWAAAVAKLKD